MKKFLLSAAAFMAAMTMNAQEVCVFNADNAMGLDSENGTAVAAGTVIGETASIVATVGGDDTYKPQSATFTVNGTDITGGLQGGTNPKDADGLVPATSLQPAAAGAFLVFEAKADGYLYVMHKASSNKAYTVFEEGVAISYTFTAIGDAASDLGAVYSFTLPYEVENEQFVVKNPIEWAEQEFLKITAPDKYAARWSKNEEGADTWDPIKINGLGVIKFPVYKDCKYIVNANGSKITAAGFAFSTADDVNITSDGIALNGEGGGSQGGAIVGEIDWTKEAAYYEGVWYSDLAEVSVTEGEGLIINCTQPNPDTANYWEPQVPMIAHIPELAEGGQYQVQFAVNAPAAGEIRLDFCSWTEGAKTTQDWVGTVEAGDNEFTVDFLDYPGATTDAMIFYQCGKIPGKHVIKYVKVIDLEAGGEEPVVEDHVYSVIGTIVGNWDNDADMVLGGNGLYVYHFENVAAGSYEFKIRQDHDWAVNWGSDFKQDGPNCKVEVATDGSTIIVTFNNKTGEIAWEVVGGGSEEPAPAIIAEIDWTKEAAYYEGVWYSDLAEVSVTEGEGLIINCTQPNPDTANYWEPQVPMIAHIPELAEGGQYQVQFAVNAPAAGEIRLDFCSWTEGAKTTQDWVGTVEAGDNEFTVDFLDYPGATTDAMIFYQCGKIPGKHVIKYVKVIDLEGLDAIQTVKAAKASTAIYNLKGQKVDASYKGIVIMNGKKYLQK